MTDSGSSLATISESPSANDSKIRSTKRKLDDAFHILDTAVSHSDNASATSDRPPPPKRANTIRSLYSTLAKYGIKSKDTRPLNEPTTLPSSKSTPHLTAILTRAATKTKNTFNFKFSSQTHTPAPLLPATAEYRPSSLPSFLSRLATYKLTTYANKPAAIDAVAASKCGWVNDGKDRLVCGLCNASWVVAGRDGLGRDAANALIEKQRVSLVGAHKNGCPWKTRQCDDSIYCIPLQSPGAMIREIKGHATTLEPVIKEVLIKHPLTTTQLNTLRSTVASYTPPDLNTSSSMDDEESQSISEPSETAILAAIFGWTLVPPSAPEPLRRASTTRASSVVSSAPPSPPLSRASSVSLHRTPPKLGRQSTDLIFRIPSTLTHKPENALLQCELCQRRIGLWAFTSKPLSVETPETPSTPTASTDAGVPSTPTSSRPKKPLPQRSFDLLKEHRSYCPYVVRSTLVPSMPIPQQTPGTPGKSGSSNGHRYSMSTSSLSHFNGGRAGALEGWRAVLTVVLRYGMADKQRIEYNFLQPRDPSDAGDGSDKMDVDNVKAMVTGVKTRGGKDLLTYVKGLLG